MLSIVLMAARAPGVLVHGRFWAEEGKTFFYHAVHHGALAALFYVHPSAAYFVLPMNAGAALASLFPLRLAPLVPPWLALAIQAIPPALILFAGGRIFATWPRKLLGVATCVFGPTMVGEVWLNTTNSASFFGIVALLILLDDSVDRHRARDWITTALLAVAAFSGPYVTALAPAFGLAAWLDRTRRRFLQVGIVAAGATLNVVLYAMRDVNNAKRSTEIGWATLDHFTQWQLLRPLLGPPVADAAAQAVGPPLAWIVPLLAVAVVAVLALVPSRVRLSWRDPRVLLLVAFVSVAGATVVGSMHGLAGGRYAAVPGFIVMVFVLHHVGRDRPALLSAVCVVVLVASLTGGAVAWHEDARLACDARHWEADLGHWEADRRYQIPICPSGWRMKLLPRARAH